MVRNTFWYFSSVRLTSNWLNSAYDVTNNKHKPIIWELNTLTLPCSRPKNPLLNSPMTLPFGAPLLFLQTQLHCALSRGNVLLSSAQWLGPDQFLCIIKISMHFLSDSIGDSKWMHLVNLSGEVQLYCMDMWSWHFFNARLHCRCLFWITNNCIQKFDLPWSKSKQIKLFSLQVLWIDHIVHEWIKSSWFVCLQL